jgi:hypothetical protein
MHMCENKHMIWMLLSGRKWVGTAFGGFKSRSVRIALDFAHHFLQNLIKKDHAEFAAEPLGFCSCILNRISSQE